MSVDDGELDALLAYLNRARGFDFTGYKRPSLTRRIEKRMQQVGANSFGAYADYLEVHPDEFSQLFDTLLINVTAFFRDGDPWPALAAHFARLVEQRSGTGSPIRVWSAGCASGEEPYTMAIILAELLGAEQLSKHVKIYATDLDEGALAQARLATYSAKSVEAVPESLREKYFARAGASYVLQKELRRSVIFGRHDLVQDAPISRVDVLSCRNTLMYFNAETQARVLHRLHFALAQSGILLLGKAEMLLAHASLFAPLDLKVRMFCRSTGAHALPFSGNAANGEDRRVAPPSDQTRLAYAAFDTLVFAQIILDESGRIALLNARAAAMFSLTPKDVGRSFHDLELSYRPAELRSCIDDAQNFRRSTNLRDVERVAGTGETTYLDIRVGPVTSTSGEVLGVSLAFIDVTHNFQLQQELRGTNVELEAAQEELQSTSEELETTNEELQSTVEELETTNEELHSSNEELGSMNGELQSANDELQVINQELRKRGRDLKQINHLFTEILGSLPSGVVVLDENMLVTSWSRKMEDMFGLRADEAAGQPLLLLDIGIPIETLGVPIRACRLDGEQVVSVITGVNRKGKPIRCQVTTNAMRNEEFRGSILLFDSVPMT